MAMGPPSCSAEPVGFNTSSGSANALMTSSSSEIAHPVQKMANGRLRQTGRSGSGAAAVSDAVAGAGPVEGGSGA